MQGTRKQGTGNREAEEEVTRAREAGDRERQGKQTGRGEGDDRTLSDVGRMGDGLRSDVQHSRHFLVVGRVDVLVDAVPGEFDLRGERGEPG